jgi:hypothetical protein
VLSFFTGAGIIAAVNSQLNEKLKDQRELAQRVDKLEKDALARNQSPAGSADTRTGAISQVEMKRKQAEVDCITARTKEVDTFTYQRKVAYAELSKCITEWKPRWFSRETADQACSPKRDAYNYYYRLVKQKEAKDCTTTASK